MKTALHKAFLISFLSITLGACGVANKPKPAKVNSNDSLTIDGTYKTKCLLEEVGSQITTDVISGSFISATNEFFSDTACRDKIYTYVTTAKWTRPGAAEKPKDTQKFDAEIQSSTLEIKNEEIASNYSQLKLFAYSDWKINTPKDILDRKVSSDSDIQLKKGEIAYDIFKRIGNKLCFGEDSGDDDKGKTPASRYDELRVESKCGLKQ